MEIGSQARIKIINATINKQVKMNIVLTEHTATQA